MAGSTLHAAGVVIWFGARALTLRVIGCVLMAVPLMVPSPLSLGLPLVAVLAMSLRKRVREDESRPAVPPLSLPPF